MSWHIAGVVGCLGAAVLAGALLHAPGLVLAGVVVGSLLLLWL